MNTSIRALHVAGILLLATTTIRAQDAESAITDSASTEQIDSLTVTFFSWSDVEDPTGAHLRIQSNNVELDVHSGEPYRYGAFDKSGNGMLVADGEFGSRTFSGGMRSDTWIGSRKGEVLDEVFYALLGVGTEVQLPDNWVSIFGIRCKSGTMVLKESGIEFSPSSIIDR